MKRIDHDVAVAVFRAAGLEPLEPYRNSRTHWRSRCMGCGAVVSPAYTQVAYGRYGGCKTCGYRKLSEALSGPNAYQWLGDDIGYQGMHTRLGHLRGKASEFDCVTCGRPASDWSYDGGSDKERIAMGGKSDGYRYSTDVNAYSPRCRSCHRFHDQEIGQ